MKHPNLDSLVPFEQRFNKLVSYRYYLFLNTNSQCDNASTNCLHKTLKTLQLTMRDHKFPEEYLRLIFHFLSRLVEEADDIGMLEGHLIVCLPHLLTKTAGKE